ncbi:MAG TPA: histidine phosphatase family protein [Gemmatimonadales bacterium]|nr:histidine phosphatase family protein [Gemmatimonadales bacterium]
MVTLLLVRHGEAEGNPEHRFIGQTDVPLTAVGHHQVRVLTERLIGLPITRVVSSDLGRCLATVSPAAAALGLEVTTDRRLREVDNGAWNGLLAEEIEARWPDLFRRYRSGEDVLRPQGEDWSAVGGRVAEALGEVIDASQAHDVVLVGTHAGPILATILRLTDGAPRNVFSGAFGSVDHCSLTVFTGAQMRLVAFNDTGHTADLTQPSWISETRPVHPSSSNSGGTGM